MAELPTQDTRKKQVREVNLMNETRDTNEFWAFGGFGIFLVVVVVISGIIGTIIGIIDVGGGAIVGLVIGATLVIELVVIIIATGWEYGRIRAYFWSIGADDVGDDATGNGPCLWWRRGRLESTIPNPLVNHDCGKECGVSWLGLDGRQGLSVDSDAGEDLLYQGFSLLMRYSGMRPKPGQIFQESSRFLQIR